MFPMQRRVLNAPVTIEYDCGKHRRRKELPNSFAARTFYKLKANAGKNPQVVGKQSEVKPFPNN